MNEISLDVPTITRYALGDLPEGEATLLRLTHAAPGATQALQEEAEEIRLLGQRLTAAYAAEPLPADLGLTPAQREQLLSPGFLAKQAAPVKKSSKGPSSEKAILFRTALWTLGSAAAVVGILFLVQTPADHGGASQTGDGDPVEYSSGKFKIRKIKESPTLFDSKDLARQMPQQLPSGKPAAAPTQVPQAEPAPGPGGIAEAPKAAPKLPNMQESVPPTRPPVPVAPGTEGARTKSFATPK